MRIVVLTNSFKGQPGNSTSQLPLLIIIIIKTQIPDGNYQHHPKRPLVNQPANHAAPRRSRQLRSTAPCCCPAIHPPSLWVSTGCWGCLKRRATCWRGQVCMCACASVCVYIYMCVCIYIYICLYMYMYITYERLGIHIAEMRCVNKLFTRTKTQTGQHLFGWRDLKSGG